MGIQCQLYAIFVGSYWVFEDMFQAEAGFQREHLIRLVPAVLRYAQTQKSLDRVTV